LAAFPPAPARFRRALPKLRLDEGQAEGVVDVLLAGRDQAPALPESVRFELHALLVGKRAKLLQVFGRSGRVQQHGTEMFPVR
jgi:hypothetical protein